MPNEHEGHDEAQAADVETESEPPPANHHKADKGDRWATRITAIAALVASLGAFFKTFDHSVTESAYNASSAAIVKLSDQQQKTQEDVASIRGYLDGLSRTPMTIAPVGSGASAPEPPSTANAASPTATVTTHAMNPVHHPADAGAPHTVITFVPVESGQAPPAVHAPAPPVKPPAFDAIGK